MARQLYLSLNTVRTHALRLRRKLGVSTRVEVVARAEERGCSEDGEPGAALKPREGLL